MYKIFANMIFIFIIGSIPLTSSASNNQKTIAEYIKVFSDHSWAEQKKICNKLQWSGISDPALFDIIDKKLSWLFPTAKGRTDIDRAAWYAKTLGTSGQEKYLATLESMAHASARSNKKLNKYAKEGIALQKKYVIWNPIISDRTKFIEDKTDEVNRFANMLKSDIWELRVIAAKRISYQKLNDTYLYDLLETVILNEYQKEYSDKRSIDSFNWMTGALSRSANKKYLPTLEMLAKDGSHSKIRFYALSRLEKDYNIGTDDNEDLFY